MSAGPFATRGQAGPVSGQASPFSHADYRVGWISALPLEFTAALAMLDKRHLPLPRLVHDNNVYMLGEIRSHNVALVCLPAGQMGNNAAATVASQMRVTFPAISFWLMVGIGGGAPSPEHDIRLGDVVVSRPGKNDAGVIQYDFGRTIEAGRFVRSGTLNAPPAILLNAVSALQGVHSIYGHQLHEHLKVFEELGALKAKYTYRGWENDIVYEASYDHSSDLSDCSQCDEMKMVRRDCRDQPTLPVIHYGSIASGNQVMRHGETRERLRKEMDVLCFEMEAAGLMNNFPCLVIRGICDYADSHKNKDWQDYAAATAAAYAKELLSFVPGSKVVTSPVPTQPVKASPAPSQSYDDHELRYLQPVPLSYLPFQRNPRFSGRKSVLSSIHAHFQRCERQHAFVLRGMGGIGKTQIALEYAYQSIDQGFDVFWVNCTTPQTLLSDFSQIQRTVKAFKQNDYEEDRVAVLRWMNYHDYWVLIFDNADDATFPYGDWMPRDTGKPSTRKIIFTTRDERLSGAVVSVKEEVPLMNEDEAVVLFNISTVGTAEVSNRSDASIKALVQRLANLPLAISLASAYLREYPWVSIDRYLKEMDNFFKRSKIFNYRKSFSNYTHSIMSTWEISFTRVQDDNPRAADLLTLLGFLVNGGVALGWLKRVSIHAANTELRFLEDIGSLEHLLGLLRSLALIHFDGATISLHPLIHEWIQARLKREELATWGTKALTAVYYAHILYAFPHSGLLDISDMCLNHTKFALKIVSDHGLRGATVAEECYLLLLTILVFKFSVQQVLDLDPSPAGVGLSPATTVSPPPEPLMLQPEQLQLQPEPLKLQSEPQRETGDASRSSIKKYFKRSLERFRGSRGSLEPNMGSSKVASQPPEPANSPPVNPLYQTTSLAGPSSVGFPADLFESNDPEDYLIVSMAKKMQRELYSPSPAVVDLCTSLAFALVELRKWWAIHSSMQSMSDPGPFDAEKSCMKLQAFIDLCRAIPNQEEELTQYPTKFLALLLIYIGSAAMNVGEVIDMKLEKPTESLRVWLFEKAFYICCQLRGEFRSPLLLDTTVSYARFVDMRSMRGPNHWLEVENCLLASVAYAFKQSGWLDTVPEFFDFFCQSMWESEHEYALFRFCRLIEQKDPRISFKWGSKLEDRWRQLQLTEDSFNTFTDTEIRVLHTFIGHEP